MPAVVRAVRGPAGASMGAAFNADLQRRAVAGRLSTCPWKDWGPGMELIEINYGQFTPSTGVRLTGSTCMLCS